MLHRWPNIWCIMPVIILNLMLQRWPSIGCIMPIISLSSCCLDGSTMSFLTLKMSFAKSSPWRPSFVIHSLIKLITFILMNGVFINPSQIFYKTSLMIFPHSVQDISHSHPLLHSYQAWQLQVESHHFPNSIWFYQSAMQPVTHKYIPHPHLH